MQKQVAKMKGTQNVQKAKQGDTIDLDEDDVEALVAQIDDVHA